MAEHTVETAWVPEHYGAAVPALSNSSLDSIYIRDRGERNFCSLFSSVQSLSRAPWTAACQASLSITNPWSLLKLVSIELVMSSSHLILCRPLLLLPPILPSIRVFSNESTLPMRWPEFQL